MITEEQKKLMIDTIIGYEGGFNDLKGDKGGKTKYGISQKAYPNEDIKNLSVDRARYLYNRDYLAPFLDLSPAICFICFDTAVNSGTIRPVKLLQISCNRLGSNLKVDGTRGSGTNAEIAKYDPEILAAKYFLAHGDFYHAIIDHDPTQQKWHDGWMNRIEKVKRDVQRFI
jgi:lysozyme family protein